MKVIQQRYKTCDFLSTNMQQDCCEFFICTKVIQQRYRIIIIIIIVNLIRRLLQVLSGAVQT